MLELYHHGSSVCAAKVRFALAEKHLDWQSHYLDILAGEHFTPAFLKLNPKAMVPVLVHDGKVLIESTLICEYLETLFPQPALYPRDPFAVYQARLWTKAVDEDLHPACSAITYVVSHRLTIMRNGVASFEEFLRAPSKESLEARKLKWQWLQHGLDAPGAADRIRLYGRYLHKMNAELAEREWLTGEVFTIADIALAPYVNRLAMLGMHEMWENGRLPPRRSVVRARSGAADIQGRPVGLDSQRVTQRPHHQWRALVAGCQPHPGSGVGAATGASEPVPPPAIPSGVTLAVEQCCGRRLGRLAFLLDRLAQHVAQLLVVLMAVDRDSMLHRSFHQFFLGVGGNRDRAVHLARVVTTVDEHSGHGRPPPAGTTRRPPGNVAPGDLKFIGQSGPRGRLFLWQESLGP